MKIILPIFSYKYRITSTIDGKLMCHDYHKLYIIEYNPYKSRERLKKIIFDYTKLKMIPQRRTKNPCSTAIRRTKSVEGPTWPVFYARRRPSFRHTDVTSVLSQVGITRADNPAELRPRGKIETGGPSRFARFPISRAANFPV